MRTGRLWQASTGTGPSLLARDMSTTKTAHKKTLTPKLEAKSEI